MPTVITARGISGYSPQIEWAHAYLVQKTVLQWKVQLFCINRIPPLSLFPVLSVHQGVEMNQKSSVTKRSNLSHRR